MSAQLVLLGAAVTLSFGCGPHIEANPKGGDAPGKEASSAAAVETSAPTATDSGVAAGPIRSAPAPDPTPAARSVSAEQALLCAQTLAARLGADVTVEPAPDSPAEHYWYVLPSVDGLNIAVDATHCSARFAAGTNDNEPTLFADLETTKRYLALRGRALKVVEADPGLAAICKRLEARRASHPNLVGCITWLESVPADVCTEPPPPSAKDDLWPVLGHRCNWRFYVGENMTTHTSRMFTLIVDPSRARVVGAIDFGGEPHSPAEWQALARQP